ncbi:hypothetical protein TWF694_009657 [Orbilia ellipsospora]|uniref:F-box domain-containing protein n=1 Tax=Orbilia ellipsospora TaxID=2528407 RepID=A0AAV9XBI3_9PEZI
MGVGIARNQHLSFATLPPELQAEIVKHLSPTEIISIIQKVRGIRGNTDSWNLSYFGPEQLIYLYIWNSRALPIDNSDHRAIYTPDLREKILFQLRTSLQKFSQPVALPLALEPFNAYYHQVTQLFTSGRSPTNQDLIDFVNAFHKRNTDVQKFCTKIAGLDSKRTVQRASKMIPDSNTWMSHLLFWFAIDYIQANSTYVSEDTISDRWIQFHNRLGEYFGEQANILLRQVAMPEGILLIKYRELLEECSRDHLAKVFNGLVHRRRDISMTTFATFMLSRGLDRALRLLDEDPDEIQFLCDQSNGTLRAWESAWDTFGCSYND